MRTTVKLDDELAREVRAIARQAEKRLGDVISGTPENGLQSRESSEPYQLATVSLGGLRADVNLDKSLSIADAIDDEELVRKVMINR